MTNRLPPIDNDQNPTDETVASDPHRTRPYAPPPQSEDTTASRVVRPVPQQQQMPPRGQHVQPIPGQRPQRPSRTGYTRRPTQRDEHGALYLPWWSLVLMLLAVLVVAFGLVAGIYVLGNPSIVTEPTPIIRIITAVPTNAQQAVQPTAQPASTQVIAGGNDTGQLALQGPTLAPVQLTATPMPITINTIVQVDGVGADELNVRDTAGVQGTNVLFRAPEGTVLTVIDGPTQADGFTWWRVRSQLNPSLEGWAVANFLAVVPNP